MTTNSLPLVAYRMAEWTAVQVWESPVELPAAAPDAAARQAGLQLAELPVGQQSEQGLPADSGVADFLWAQIDARTVKLELAVGSLAQERRLLPDSAFERSVSARSNSAKTGHSENDYGGPRGQVTHTRQNLTFP